MRVLRFNIGLTSVLLAAGPCTTSSAQSPDGSLLLTNAAQIRQLTTAQAAKSVPVHLRGVVTTEAGPFEHAVVIWNESAPIYLLAPTNLFSDIRRGDLLDATGVTDPGEFAPIVKVSSVQKIGSGATPDPKPVTLEELLSGGLDAQWIEISGVVRSLDAEMLPGVFGRWHMDVGVGGGKVSVVSNGARPAEVAPDAKVRVLASCFYQFNQRRQVLRPMLLIPTNVPIEIITPAPAEAEAAPVRPVGSLLEFSPESASGHRVHVRGVVTHQEPGTAVWIRDDSGALRIQTGQLDRVQPGDEIDVLGFPKYGSYAPALEDAIFTKRSSGKPPAPVRIATPASAFEHQADLISLTATLMDIQPLSDGWLLTLQETNTSFKVMIKKSAQLSVAPQCAPGSLVRVSGICSFVGDDSGPVLSGVWRPQSFQLLLRAPGDLITLVPPPWWTPRHIISLLLAVTGGSVLVTAFVTWGARRRLREQAQRRAMAEAEFTAILSERNRVAREIHDTLAQGLAATSIHLRLAKKNANGSPESVSHHLEVAQQLVRDSLEEARNSIWNMRSQVLETADLTAALKGILQQMSEGTVLKFDFQTTGRPRRLAPVLENNILRVGQEAISNAVRHANAKSISVNLIFGHREFCLKVKDDGRGFDPAKPPAGEGGFGLVGMRERAEHIKGQLEISSGSEQGTELTLRVPLSGE